MLFIKLSDLIGDNVSQFLSRQCKGRMVCVEGGGEWGRIDIFSA